MRHAVRGRRTETEEGDRDAARRSRTATHDRPARPLHRIDGREEAVGIDIGHARIVANAPLIIGNVPVPTLARDVEMPLDPADQAIKILNLALRLAMDDIVELPVEVATGQLGTTSGVEKGGP